MLVTFKCKSFANITMFGDVAVKLLKFMGHSGTVPGAIQAEDIPTALTKLKQAVTAEVESAKDSPGDIQKGDESEDHICIDTRAKPLIELLESAVAQNEYVMWDK